MNVDIGIWNKLTKVVVLLLLLTGVIALVIWYLPLIQTNERYRKQVMALDKEIENQEAIARETRAAIETLRTNPKEVERIARGTLGLAKEGETVIHFESPPTNVILH